MKREELLQAAKPILFNTDMVQAILDGRKTVTRRIIKLKYDNTYHEMKTDKYGTRLIEIQNDVEGLTYGTREDGTTWRRVRGYIEPKPPYKKGDILYVRETWDYIEGWKIGDHAIEGKYFYRADGDLRPVAWRENWSPSIHMPKEAARIFLNVKDVRVERLQEITEEQVYEEGFRFKPPCLSLVSADGHYCDLDGPCTSSIKYCDMSMGELFGKELWDYTIKKSDLDRYGWDANPWVWVIEFDRIDKE